MEAADPRLEALARTMKDRRAFIRKFVKFTPKEGAERRSLDPLYQEQEDILSDLTKYTQNIYLKPRNVGAGTVIQANDVWYATRTRDPVSTLCVVHDDEAKKRHMDRYKEFWENLPPALRRPHLKKNEDELILRDSAGQPGAAFRVMIASGKSEGKGSTFQRLHFTELADYEESKAENLVASIRGAVHPGPHYALTIESTAKGPGNYFARLWDTLRLDETWNHRFFSWKNNPIYSRPVADPRKFLESMTDAERLVQRRHTLTLEQMAFRRDKITLGGVTAFHHYYPLTPEEAFLGGGVSFFPADALTTMAFAAPKVNRKRGVFRFEEWSPVKTYAVGVDVSQGLGKKASGGDGDWSVICVVDNYGNQVAVWSDNTTPPQSVGEQAVLLAAEYGNAILLIESNGPGLVALGRARQVGYDNFWMQNGKDFVTWGNVHTTVARGDAMGGKNLVFNHARQKILDKACTILDTITIEELMNVQEDAKYRIAAANGRHDDHAMAWVLAMWAARRIEGYEHDPIKVLDDRFHFNRHRSRPTTPWSR